MGVNKQTQNGRFIAAALMCLLAGASAVAHGSLRSWRLNAVALFPQKAGPQKPVGAVSVISQQERVIKIQIDNRAPEVDQVVPITVIFPKGFEQCGFQYTLSFGDGDSTIIGGGAPPPHPYRKEGRYRISITYSPSRDSVVVLGKMARLCSSLQLPEEEWLTVQPQPRLPTGTSSPSVMPSPGSSPTLDTSPTPSPPETPSPTPTPAGPSPTVTRSPGTSTNSHRGTFPTPTPDSGGGISWPDLPVTWWYLLALMVPVVPFVGYRA